MNAEQKVRKTLELAIEKVGGTFQVATVCKVKENTVRFWIHRGHLNGVAVEHALRLADAAKTPIDHFLIDWP